MRRVVTFIYCEGKDCHYRINTQSPRQIREKLGWTEIFEDGETHDYCPEHRASDE